MRRAISIGTWLAVVGLAASGVVGQMPPATVRYTPVQMMEMSESVRLTGSVESRLSSLVAARVAGVVEALLAREGERVSRGQHLVRLDGETLRYELQSAQGQLEEAEARLRLAESNLTRLQGLYEEQVISLQQLDDARSENEAWRGRRAQLEADAARLRHDVEQTVVRAPFAGVVVDELVAVGEWVAAGEAVLELLGLDDLEVTVEVPERDFSGLAEGASVPVRFEALPGVEVRGKVRAIVPRADSESRSFPVKVAIPNQEGRIGVGMLAEVALPIGHGRPALAVPKDAVVRQGGSDVVFVVGEDETVRRVEVRTGGALGGWIAVESELVEGDLVVTRGNERLMPGQQVQGALLEYEG